MFNSNLYQHLTLTKMKTHHNYLPNEGLESMLNLKTYEDFNQIKPDSTDSDAKESKPVIALPFVIDDGEKFNDTVKKNEVNNADKVQPKIVYHHTEKFDDYNYLRD